MPPDKTPRKRAEDLIRLLVPDWRPTPQQVLWAIRIAIVVTIILIAVLLILDLVGLLFGITVLNLLKVLAVPITLGAAVPLLNWLQKKRELDVEYQRSQDEALQAYMDGISQLLTDKEQPLHSAKPGDSLSSVARARTLTVLGRLDGDRKRSVLQFLFESELIDKEHTLLNEADLIERRHNIVSLVAANLRGADLRVAILRGADLRRADLRGVDLRGAVLSGAVLRRADLRGADLRAAILIGADLREADLRAADLLGANLFEANLIGADLREAILSGVNLSGAVLRRAVLSEADLSEADLSEADLRRVFLTWGLSGAVLSESEADLPIAAVSGTNLTGAQGWTEDQLSEARTLVGATMPDGQILQGDAVPDGPTFEEWLKSKGRGEASENE